MALTYLAGIPCRIGNPLANGAAGTISPRPLRAAGFVTSLVPVGIMTLLGIAIGAVLPPINH